MLFSVQFFYPLLGTDEIIYRLRNQTGCTGPYNETVGPFFRDVCRFYTMSSLENYTPVMQATSSPAKIAPTSPTQIKSTVVQTTSTRTQSMVQTTLSPTLKPTSLPRPTTPPTTPPSNSTPTVVQTTSPPSQSMVQTTLSPTSSPAVTQPSPAVTQPSPAVTQQSPAVTQPSPTVPAPVSTSVATKFGGHQLRWI
jgi:hypothetical protein